MIGNNDMTSLLRRNAVVFHFLQNCAL